MKTKKENLWTKATLANKITMSRLGLSAILMGIMVINIPFANSIIQIFTALLFGVTAATDKLDGSIARKKNEITDTGKILDAIADKFLVNQILYLMAMQSLLLGNVLGVICPLIISCRDDIVNGIKTIASSKGPTVAASILGKLKTAITMPSMFLILLPMPYILGLFGLTADLATSIGAVINVIGQAGLVAGTGLSVVSGVQYYKNNRQYINTGVDEPEETKENLNDGPKRTASKKRVFSLSREPHPLTLIPDEDHQSPKKLIYGPKDSN